MEIETISITTFRKSLTSLCYAVKLGRKELAITHYNEILFKVVKLQSEAGIEVNLTDVRDRKAEFINLLETHGSLILSTHNKPLARCIKC